PSRRCGLTGINGAFTHPMPRATAEADRAAVGRRSLVGGPFVHTADVRPMCAALHFEGALLDLAGLKEQGLDVRVVIPRAGRIHMADIERLLEALA
ncbi:MAG TPA: hypothetical protein VMW48_08275, partial [Vicinamibacterales bacterium]|nr:hypothetical protein [Vicinamibacterales bacterium]